MGESSKKGMKPPCAHPSYFRNDANAVYIGQETEWPCDMSSVFFVAETVVFGSILGGSVRRPRPPPAAVVGPSQPGPARSSLAPVRIGSCSVRFSSV